jgi:hypothetical protein
MLVKESPEDSEPYQDNTSRETLLAAERNQNSPPSAPPPLKAVLFCPIHGQVCHVKRCLTMLFADNVDISHMYAEMDNDEHTEIQLNFQYAQDPSVFITTPKVGGTGLNRISANHAVRTQKF